VLSNTYTLTTGIGVGGTVAFSDAQFTINGGGHITLTPQSGYSSVAINGGTVATTLDIGPGYVGQHQRVEFIQVGTTSSLNFGTTVAFGADIPSFTATAIVGYRDLLQFFCLDGSHWALAAVNHGFAY
jgi:hypothetical protein